MLCIFFATACSDMLDNPTRDTEVLVPLTSGTLKIQNAIEEENKNIAEDGRISIIYKQNLFTNTVNAPVQIGDASGSLTYTAQQPQTYNPGNFIFGQNQNIPFASNNSYRKVLFTQLRFNAELTTDISDDVNYRLSFPEFKQNGNNVSFLLQPDANGNYTVNEKLTNVVADLTGQNKNLLNNAHLILIATAGDGVVSLNAGDEVELNLSITETEIEFGRGSFTTQNLPLQSAEKLTSFSNFSSGTLSPSNATLDVTIENRTGVFATLDIESIESVKSETGSTIKLVSDALSRPVHISPAPFKYQTLTAEKPSIRAFQITAQNSNINEFIGQLPDVIEQSASLVINPRGNNTSANDFIRKDQGITAVGTLNVPLRLAAAQLVLTEKYAFDLQENQRETTDRIQAGRLLLNTANGYPLDAEIQGYFIDEQGNILDSLFSETAHVTAANIDENNETVIEPVREQFEVPLSPQLIDRLYLAGKIEFKLTLNTPNDGAPVPFFDHYAMHLDLAGDLIYKLDLR